jgi:succinylarginine dihydrolase
MTEFEYNFDGIVGPTHNYAGLSFGNVASMKHKSAVSSPKRAALEGLAKMKFLMDLGVKQAVLPPHERPHLPTLRKHGITGTDTRILERAPAELLAACSSASAMWAANAATVSPSADCADGRVHITPANLVSNLHRSIETPMTTRILRYIFSDEQRFAVHDAQPPDLPDEGAANHMRICERHDLPGLEIFVYGRGNGRTGPTRFPARQSYEACAAIARNHMLDPRRVLFVQQNPEVIDAGAFHNDVVAVGNEVLVLCHRDAHVDPVPKCAAADLPIADALGSYLFNSQLVTLPSGVMALIAPVECAEYPRVQEFISSMSEGKRIEAVHYVDVRQSMSNGGGPACLRLRIVLVNNEPSAVLGRVFLDDALCDELKNWIEEHYRDELRPADLRDPKLLTEGRDALDELSRLLELGNIYDFQRGG